MNENRKAKFHGVEISAYGLERGKIDMRALREALKFQHISDLVIRELMEKHEFEFVNMIDEEGNFLEASNYWLVDFNYKQYLTEAKVPYVYCEDLSILCYIQTWGNIGWEFVTSEFTIPDYCYYTEEAPKPIEPDINKKHDYCLEYLLNCVIDDIELESDEGFTTEEIEELKEFISDNDCDIIAELISTMKEEISEKIEEIIENRVKIFNVCFNVTTDVNLEVKAHSYEELDRLIEEGSFKRFLLDYLDAYDVDVDIDHAEEIEYTDYYDCDTEDYI